MDYVLEDFTKNERNHLLAMRETLIDTVHQIIAVILSPPGEFPASFVFFILFYQTFKVQMGLLF